MKVIFPDGIDSDLLFLAHLSNGFCVIEDARPLQVGNRFRTEAQIISIVNNDSWKAVEVKKHIYQNQMPVIEVITSFLYYGCFSDYEKGDADAGVLQSKKWFQLGCPCSAPARDSALFPHQFPGLV
jgi:fatty acid synthase subunit beta